MSTKSIIRPISRVGTIVLPRELLRSMDIHPGDPMKISTDGERIVLKKAVEARCIFCGLGDNLTIFMGKPVCAGCISRLANIIE